MSGFTQVVSMCRTDVLSAGIPLGSYPMPKPSEEMLLCTKCIQNEGFARWIKENGQRGQCDFIPEHGNRVMAITVGIFAVHVDEYFRKHYQTGREYPYISDDSGKISYEQRGSPLVEILLDDLNTDDDVLVEAIIDNLPDATHREIAQGADVFYERFRYYERIADAEAEERADEEAYWYENRFTYQWQDFCEIVRYNRRFFKNKDLLDKLFGQPAEYEGEGKINPVYMLTAEQKIFRARFLGGSLTETMLERSPAKELGAPPKERTPAGRMNVEYIPVFYGAFSEQTAVAEMRPGIGEELAIGEFVLQRDIKVFDFSVFSRAPQEEWSKNYAHTRYDFIKQMEDEISKRVLPYEKQLQYISTQIVAEYLKEFFGCEGVIFGSSVVMDRDAENRNIVLLPRAESFTEGDSAILKYERFAIKEIRNVSYQIVDSRIF